MRIIIIQIHDDQEVISLAHGKSVRLVSLEFVGRLSAKERCETLFGIDDQVLTFTELLLVQYFHYRINYYYSGIHVAHCAAIVDHHMDK